MSIANNFSVWEVKPFCGGKLTKCWSFQPNKQTEIFKHWFPNNVRIVSVTYNINNVNYVFHVSRERWFLMIAVLNIYF